MITQPSSIGTVGRPFHDNANDRVKGFCTYVVDDRQVMEEYLEKARNIRNVNGVSRITLRFLLPTPGTNDYHTSLYGFTAPSVSQDMDDSQQYVGGFETIPIPLTGDWRRFCLRYFGENSTRRTEPDSVRIQEDDIIRDSLAAVQIRDHYAKARRNGYTLETHRDLSDRDIISAHDLYSRVYQRYLFDLTEENVADLLQNPGSITSIARDKNENIVSIAVAEVVEIPTNKGLLRISEISDEATDPAHRGNGLNQGCVKKATEELIRLYGDEVHMIYAEDRAPLRDVNQQSANLGWNFAGRLNRQCVISADNGINVEGPHEDLNVWYAHMR